MRSGSNGWAANRGGRWPGWGFAGAKGRGTGGSQGGGRLRWQDAVFGVHVVFGEIGDLDWTKGAQSHVQGDRADGDPLATKPIQQLRREVQSGGGRGDRTGSSGVDRLVAV